MGGVIAIAALVPICMGVGIIGIVGGSAAVGIEAGIGTIAAGSLFAITESVGATAVLFGATEVLVCTAAVSGTVAVAGVTTAIVTSKKIKNS